MVRVFLRIWHHICVLCPCSPSSSVTLMRLPWVGDWWDHLNLQQQLPISLLLHPRRGFPPVPDRSACRGLGRLQTHTSSSSPVVPLFSVPERAIFLLLRWLLWGFFFSPLQFLLLFVPPFVFSLKIFCHLPSQLFFTLDFPVPSLCHIAVSLNPCSLTCTCCFSVSCVLGLASGFVIHHSYSFTVWSPHFCPG